MGVQLLNGLLGFLLQFPNLFSNDLYLQLDKWVNAIRVNSARVSDSARRIRPSLFVSKLSIALCVIKQKPKPDPKIMAKANDKSELDSLQLDWNNWACQIQLGSIYARIRRLVTYDGDPPTTRRSLSWSSQQL